MGWETKFKQRIKLEIKKSLGRLHWSQGVQRSPSRQLPVFKMCMSAISIVFISFLKEAWILQYLRTIYFTIPFSFKPRLYLQLLPLNFVFSTQSLKVCWLNKWTDQKNEWEEIPHWTQASLFLSLNNLPQYIFTTQVTGYLSLCPSSIFANYKWKASFKQGTFNQCFISNSCLCLSF